MELAAAISSRELFGTARLGGEGTDLVGDGIGVGPALQGHPNGRRASSESCTGDAKGVHDDLPGQLRYVSATAQGDVVNKSA